jgi:dihydrolipoamide dehydrogenase
LNRSAGQISQTVQGSLSHRVHDAAMDEYDVIVLGAGPAGENAAERVRRGGLTVALVEAELLGGECSYWACMPSKTILRPGAILASARRVPGAREAVTGALDAGAALAWRNWMVSDWHDDSQAGWASSAGIDVVRGRGRLDGERRVVVSPADGPQRTLTARRAVVVATGSVPVLPPIPGLADTAPWGSREATSSKHVPERLAVIGGGVVACEMAQAWRSLGSRAVTMLVRGERLLERHEPFAGDLLAAAFAEQGIEVRFGAATTEVRRRAPDAPVTVVTDAGDLVVDELLLATGRRPNTSDIGLDSVGLEPGSAIAVDDQLRATGVAGGWLYAVGDVNGRNLLTHMGKYQGRLVGDIIAHDLHLQAFADHEATAGVVFTDPQVGSVGHTEASARDAGVDVAVVDVDLGEVPGVYVSGEGIKGRARLVIDRSEPERVVGATFVGPEIADLVHQATIAIVGRVPLGRLWHAVAAFPTVSEVWLDLLKAYGL